jgi:hypothetical protein
MGSLGRHDEVDDAEPGEMRLVLKGQVDREV